MRSGISAAVVGASVGLLLTFTAAPSASAGDDDPEAETGVVGSGNPEDATAELEATDVLPEEDGSPNGDGTPVAGGPRVEAMRLLFCAQNYPGKPEMECASALSCPEQNELRYTVWWRQPPADGWMAGETVCLGPEEVPDRPRITPDLVLREVRRIGLPALRVHVQPEGETLVHFDTIFFAEPEPFERTVQLLGFTVDVRATASSYDWAFGDGAGATTSTPGGPYPDKSVTHAYTDAHVTERASVDVTYTVRFRVDGGAWQSIDETVTADGPVTTVAVKEAVPVLSGGG